MDGSFRDRARHEAEEKGWEFEEFTGGLGLFQRLLSGDWNAREFLVLPPGRRIEPSYKEDIVRIGG